MLDWIYKEPSAPWIWAGIIIAFAGFFLAVMALPTVFQMILGKPQVLVEFKASSQDEYKALQCHIANKPINCGFLRKLGVTRQATHITASISVYEEGTKKPIREHAMLLINQGAGESVEIANLTTVWPLIIAPFGKEKETPAFINDGNGKVEIAPGYYTVELFILCEDRNKIIVEKGLHVGQKMSDLWWRD